MLCQRPSLLRSATALALGLLASSLAACDTTVPPRNSLDEEYTVWGALDPTQQLQAIRVLPIIDSPEHRTNEPLDVTVTSTDLDTGVQTVWRDTVVTYTFLADTSARIYVAGLQPAFGSRHQLDIVPAVGKPLQVYIPVPPEEAPVLSRILDYAGPVYTITWPGSGQLNAARLTYRIQDFDCEIEEYTYTFPGDLVRSDAGASLTFNLQFTAGDLRGEFPDGSPNPSGPLKLPIDGLRIETEVASETWEMSPDLAADPEALRKPDVFTNVESGFGFVGSAYPDTVRWVPTVEELAPSETFFPIPPVIQDSSLCGPKLPRSLPENPEF